MNAAPKPATTYRGWVVAFEYGCWNAISPDYDGSWEGEEDGWVDNGQKASGRTYDEMCAEVDEWFTENGQFGLGA